MTNLYTNLTPPDADDLNTTHEQGEWAIRQAGLNAIQQLEDRDITFSVDGGQFVETYIDDTGRKDSVDTGAATTADFTTDNYSIQLTEGTVENNAITDVTSVSASTDFTTTISVATDGFFSSIGFKSGGTTTLKIEIKIGSEIIASVPEAGYSTQDFTFVSTDYSRMIIAGETVDIVFTGVSGTAYNREASDTYSGTNFSYTSQPVLSVSSGNGYKFTPVTGITTSEISHTIPAGYFKSTISTACMVYKANQIVSGATVRYKLTNATEDTGWLTPNKRVSFTALTAEPDELLVELDGDIVSLNGVALYADEVL